MISLIRNRTKTAIHKNFTGDFRFNFNKELIRQEIKIAKNELENRIFDSKRWAVSKKQLFTETFDKCAYCETSTKVVAHGDVEHFRPKNKYWWLAYCYENYLVSCSICNEIHKRDKFPVLNSNVSFPIIDKNLSEIDIEELSKILNPEPFDKDSIALFMTFNQEEKPLLINPYYQDPELFFAYEVDEIIKSVNVVPLTPQVEPFVKATVEIYGLNRKELQDLRFKIFEIYDLFKLTLKENGISSQTRQKVLKQIEKMKLPDAQFAGMIRFFDRTLH